jgi:hypothetical protein
MIRFNVLQGVNWPFHPIDLQKIQRFDPKANLYCFACQAPTILFRILFHPVLRCCHIFIGPHASFGGPQSQASHKAQESTPSPHWRGPG